ncbi:MAG: NAD(P)-dependent methylenetetrahydromethanopterin dehydrogenase [Candidatus Bathyarchaeia archaeon]
MKTLEIAPLEGKVLRVIIVEKEYSEPFWITEPINNCTPKNLFTSVFKPSIAFRSFLEKLIDEVKPDFATEELGNRSITTFNKDNVLIQLFQNKRIPLYPVDIDENARGYLLSLIEEKKQLRDKIIKAMEDLPSKEGDAWSVEEEYLMAYGQCLQQEIEEMEREAKFSVREGWIAMGILENAKKIEKEDVTCLHISSPEHVNGVKKLLESVDVEVETIQPTKKLLFANKKAPTEEIEDLLNSMQIQVKPVIKKTAEEAPNILFFLDTDKRASPFDICMAYDAGFSVVVPYENVTPEDAKRIVQDAIFSRDPKGIKHTCFFIGGKDMEKAEEILKVARESMFPPFQASTIIDPAGAYTTAAAMVAKVEEALTRAKLGNLKDKRCAIFGTGSIGRVAAILLARLGCEVMIVSPNPERADGEEYVTKLADLLRTKYGVEVKGVFAPTPNKKVEVMEKADVIFCASVAGVRIISKEMLNEMKFVKVIADVNAVPPLGVEGMKLEDDMREISPGIFGIGALTIGRLKYKLEREILKEARRNGKGTVYNYNHAFQLARKILKGEISPMKISVTLNYGGKEKKGS